MNNAIQLFSIVLITLLMTSFKVFAQGSDMIVLKKGAETTVKTYMAGSQIHFVSNSRIVVQGKIKKIENDSVYINIYDHGPVYNRWGTTFWDTLSVSLTRYHINEISEIVKPREGLAFIKNGFLFMLGGISYAILHSVNAAYLKQPIIPSTMLISGSVALTGYALNRIHKNTIRLGNRYYLQYIPLK